MLRDEKKNEFQVGMLEGKENSSDELWKRDGRKPSSDVGARGQRFCVTEGHRPLRGLHGAVVGFFCQDLI